MIVSYAGSGASESCSRPKESFLGLPMITFDASGMAEIPANPARKGLMVQAGEDNAANVMIAGCIRVKPDGFAMIPASNALIVQGVEGDVITLGEVV